MSTVLITGIAGFIGSSLARALVAEGATVRGIDNLSSGSLVNLEEIRKKIDFRYADVLDKDEVSAAMKGVDYVFHEAAIPSVPKSVNDPVGTNGPNLTGTLTVLEAARQAGVKRLLYAASSAAYGDNPALPKTEAMLPEPISPYAVQKVAGEHYLSSYYKVYGLETVSLRYFNIFGPRQDPSSQYSGVLARFISLMLAGKTPTIYGDGLTSRDFTYIDNVVSANLLAAKAPAANVAGKIFNVATGRRVTLLDAFAEIKRILGFPGEVIHEEERNGDIKHSGADISAAQAAFGYEVIADLGYGLEKTIEWARETAPVA
ncbi:MAG: NAD-dependent epimerase/dehydratase family protein [Edaphobacter sp.]|uniref:NAD-dependent epimerase/dehydratase family protein n=1 Tax=Edaphobacter sp. TaxID=1934404 RepID=UPI00239DE42C|nr:NAD-dependent epimerase/dehydratase family protein [Edaphobacter sp.]MDE1178133.1 NAD-dependent epimerase/dehydratase family protein [Edaphobacter sp.]